MDNIHVDDVIIDKKLDAYGGYDKYNFIAPREVTITITRDEYFDLVSCKATKEYAIKQAENDRYARNQENEKLKKENERLMAEMYELKKQIDELKEQIKKETEDDA